MNQETLNKKVVKEFLKFKKTLEDNDIIVKMYNQLKPELPDSVFPNNWFSTHRGEDFPKGLFVLYPMKTPSREAEKSREVIFREGRFYNDFLELDRQSED